MSEHQLTDAELAAVKHFSGEDIPPHQQRVVDEVGGLDEKIKKLHAFIFASPAFGSLSTIDQDLLRRQMRAMGSYGHILRQRLKHWGVNV